MTTRESGSGWFGNRSKNFAEHGGSIHLRDAQEVSDFKSGACIEMRVQKPQNIRIKTEWMDQKPITIPVWAFQPALQTRQVKENDHVS